MAAPLPWRVYLVEDHALVRESYVALLDLMDDYEVCGEAETAEAALDAVPALRPDLVLIDVSLPDMNGLDLVRALRVRTPDVATVVVTGHDGAHYQAAAETAGADGFVMKQDGPDAILDALERVRGARAALNG